MTNFVPAEVIPPGEYIQDELDARDWTQEDLASILGISRRQVINLITGASGITPEIAQALADAFDQDAETWIRLQIMFELAKAAKGDRKVKKRAEIYNKYPVRHMLKRGWVEASGDPDELSVAICRFLNIESISDKPAVSWAARKSGSYGSDSGAQIAWYFRSRQLARCVHVTRPYSERRFGEMISELRLLAKNKADIRRVPAVLANYGIRLILVQGLSGSKVDGGVFWLDDQPVIVLALRFDRLDNFWFTLFHELIHIKYRDGDVVDVELLEGNDDELPESEKRANSEAAEALIPKKKLDSFILRTRPLYYERRILEFAAVQDIHPGIVVGQLHWRKELKPQQLRKLLEPIRGEIIGAALTDGWDNCPVVGGE